MYIYIYLYITIGSLALRSKVNLLLWPGSLDQICALMVLLHFLKRGEEGHMFLFRETKRDVAGKNLKENQVPGTGSGFLFWGGGGSATQNGPSG